MASPMPNVCSHGHLPPGYPSQLIYYIALMNVLETLGNIAYLYLAHVALSPVAPLIGFTSAALTLAKTILYWAQEYYCGYCSVGHNSLKDLAVFWILPNG